MPRLVGSVHMEDGRVFPIDTALTDVGTTPSPPPGPAPTPTPTPVPVPPSPNPRPDEDFMVVHGDPQNAMREVRPGAKLNFLHERWEQTTPLEIPAIEGLTLMNLHLYGPTLTPDEPSIWAKLSKNLTLTIPIILGSPIVGKWSRELGNKQHGVMAGQVAGLTVRGGIIVGVGGDWFQFTDKPGTGACTNILVEDMILVYSRRQGFSFAGAHGATVRRVVTSNAQRTLLDFESEGGGAKNILIEECDFDCFTRTPNYVISIGGADRPGAVNEGPFTMRRNRIYGQSLTQSNRSIGKLILEDNKENVSASTFPDLKALVTKRFPHIPDLPKFLTPPTS